MFGFREVFCMCYAHGFSELDFNCQISDQVSILLLKSDCKMLVSVTRLTNLRYSLVSSANNLIGL